ncbi:MAG: DUF1015 domain-containing protein [Spirochaetia bacterium]|nr:DUF1015 domain-containing protein [Spirochaetia bacterium]
MAKLALHPADILIPKKGINLRKWATVACDQYTSNKSYWERVSNYVGNAYSTLALTFPEVYLEDEDSAQRIERINKAMEQYVKDGIFDTYHNCFMLVRRDTPRSTRWGLVGCLDLEAYDFSPDSTSLIRATEGTIVSRIPPRKAIREHALLELPHIMVLIDDGEKSLIEPLKAGHRLVYDTDLMENGGHVSGYLVDSEEDFTHIAEALQGLYDKLDPDNPLLFAMGDGNHSLATAKSCWEDIRNRLSPEEALHHPARYALVEIENIHDEGLEFEPIHRVFFNLSRKEFDALLTKQCRSFSVAKVTGSAAGFLKQINEPGAQRFGLSEAGEGLLVYTLSEPKASLAAGSIQSVIDLMLETTNGKVDYIHGVDETLRLGNQTGNLGLVLPDVSKQTFFSAIIKDRALPRKTFSMGEANEKRYYLEARSLKD